MTMPQLIQIALNEEDEDKAWDAVTVLQFRGTQEVLEAAQRPAFTKVWGLTPILKSNHSGVAKPR